MAGRSRSVEFDLLVTGTEQGGRKVEKLGDKFDELRHAVERLDGKTAKVKGIVKLEKDTDRLGARLREAGDKVRAMGAKVLSAAPMFAKLAVAAGGLHIAIAALPAIAAIAAGGLVAALGGGLIALGVKIGLHNKEVKDSFSRTWEHIRKGAEGFGKPFEKPLLNVSKRFRETFDDFRPSLQAAMDRLGPVFDTFTGHVFDGVKRLAPSLGPVTGAFERLVGAVGPQVPGIFDKFAQAIDNVATAVNNNPAAFGQMIDGIATATVKLTEFVGFLSQLPLNMKIAWVRANLAVREGILDMANSLAGLPGPVGKSFQSFADSAKRKVGEAQTKLNGLNTLKAQGQIKTLNDKINFLKGKTVKTDVDRGAIVAAREQLAKLMASINRVHGKTVVVSVVTTGANVGALIGGRAAGGPVKKGVPYVVGEKRPEVFVPGESGTIIPRVPTPRVPAGWNGGGGGGTTIINVNLPRYVGSRDDLIREIRAAVKTKGGGNVQVALGRGR